jgi:hypothetical protein
MTLRWQCLSTQTYMAASDYTEEVSMLSVRYRSGTF